MRQFLCAYPQRVPFGPDQLLGDVWERCGHCEGCVNHKIQDFIGRTMLEAGTAVDTAIVTATYHNDYELDRRYDLREQVCTLPDIQSFIENLRTWYPLRNAYVAEAGELHGRLHWHLLLHFQSDGVPSWPNGERFQVPEWPHGHIYNEWGATPKAAGYVAKYMMKDRIAGNMSKRPIYGHDGLRAIARHAASLNCSPKGNRYSAEGPRGRAHYILTGRSAMRFVGMFDEEMALLGRVLDLKGEMNINLNHRIRLADEARKKIDAFMCRADADYLATTYALSCQEVLDRAEKARRVAKPLESEWQSVKELGKAFGLARRKVPQSAPYRRAKRLAGGTGHKK